METIDQVVLKLWNSGKDVAYITKHVEHRYANALGQLIRSHIKLCQQIDDPTAKVRQDDPTFDPFDVTGGAV